MKTYNMMFAYRRLLSEIRNHGVTERNARTNTEIRMLRGGYSFKLDLSDGRLPVPGNRRYYPHVAAAEVAWQFMGTKDPTFIVRKAPKIWSKFVEKETYTTNNGDGEGPVEAERDVLKTAYGYRWREHFGRDQLLLAVEELRNNPTNRQLFISAWDPSSDGLGGSQPKNIPCPVGFTVSRYEQELHMSVFIRSSDVFVGLPYDVMGYALTMDAIAASVGLTPSTLMFSLAHPHVYKPHWNAVRACIADDWTEAEWRLRKEYEAADVSWPSNCEPNLPGWTIEQIVGAPSQYIENVKLLANRVNNNSWNPCPEVIE